ncbi:hypothetical protein Scani_37100 [Streptomyces caniferus]|uniref:Uncharacterized protein n=1 Tax=Streptomyces caniferus TaxID=285557 RepID=A0A640SA96_9ACTN|nr:hypothetical protein Scani_37100 [Streptomyces caniferus]
MRLRPRHEGEGGAPRRDGRGATPEGRAHRVVCGFVFRFAYRCAFRPRRPVSAPRPVTASAEPAARASRFTGRRATRPRRLRGEEAGAEPDDGVLTSSAGGAVKKERFGGEPGGQV